MAINNNRMSLKISFGEYDSDVYEFLRDTKNASGLIRSLVRSYMNNTGVTIAPPVTQAPAEVQRAKPISKKTIIDAEGNVIETGIYKVDIPADKVGKPCQIEIEEDKVEESKVSKGLKSLGL